jgi:hypothetical protein
MTPFEKIGEAAARFGLAVSALNPAVGGAIVLLAYDGPAMWEAYAAAPEAADGAADPLDRWSARITAALAKTFGARPISPNERPYPPFATWAMAAEPVWPSPLGMLVHARRGLWVSYRGALAFDEALDIPARAPAAKPCDACPGKPCLTACPVGAFTDKGYDIPACLDWLGRPQNTCLDGGCLARRACPVGRNFAHRPAQAGHHMQAFLRTQSMRSGRRPDH